MKKIQSTELENISGGGFMDGFCAVVGTAGTAAFILGVATGGVSAFAAGLASGACVAYAWHSLK